MIDKKGFSQVKKVGFIGGFTVTPHDVNDLSQPCMALWVGGDGNIKLNTVDGSTITLKGVTAGTILHIQATKVYATGTTATDIVALY